MADINPGIFKKYDIRGVAVGDGAVINAEIAHLIGQGVGTYLQRFEQIQTVVAGRDNRSTSADLQAALMKGLSASGCEVIDIGLVSTPLVYWHSVTRGNIGGMMVTGSHLAPKYNGFKLAIGNTSIYDHKIKLIGKLVQEQDFTHGHGTITVDPGAYSAYIHDLTQRVHMARPLKVVVDAGNGTGGIFGPRLIEKWGHEITGIFLEPDENFPNHIPNPQEPKNMVALGEKVREVGADIGIAFDGDADRMGAVDENGALIAADRLLALLAQDMLKRHPGAAVVGEVLCSDVLFDVVLQAGGKPHMAASGHAIVKDTMHNTGALLAGEMSGHIFIAEDYLGFDDGYLTAGRILQLLAASDKPLSALDNMLPRLYSTPEYRPHCPDESKETVIKSVGEQLQDKGTVVDVDGVRIKFEKGWGIIRASNTEPVLSLRFEGETETDALAIRDLFAGALKQFPQVAQLTD